MLIIFFFPDEDDEYRETCHTSAVAVLPQPPQYGGHTPTAAVSLQPPQHDEIKSKDYLLIVTRMLVKIMSIMG